MKEKLVASSLLLCLLLMAACSKSPSFVQEENELQHNLQDIQEISTSANYKSFEEEIPLFDDADLVVIAQTDTVFTSREHVLNYVERDENQQGLPPALSGFYTHTPIKILKVLKQSESRPVNENEQLNIMEPIALIEDESGLKKISIEHYSEIKEGEKYVIYLKQNTNGDYGVINMNNGKFNLESETLRSNSFEDVNENEQQKHNELRRSVEERFAEEIEEVSNM